MKRNKIIEETIFEVERFLERIKAVPVYSGHPNRSKEVAARRASMDLTRQLVKIRQVWSYEK